MGRQSLGESVEANGGANHSVNVASSVSRSVSMRGVLQRNVSPFRFRDTRGSFIDNTLMFSPNIDRWSAADTPGHLFLFHSCQNIRPDLNIMESQLVNSLIIKVQFVQLFAQYTII